MRAKGLTALSRALKVFILQLRKPPRMHHPSWISSPYPAVNDHCEGGRPLYGVALASDATHRARGEINFRLANVMSGFFCQLQPAAIR